MSEKTLEMSLVSFLSRFPDFFRQRADSLEEFNSVLYNEHITLVEQSLLGIDCLPGILDSVQIMLAANQLTAVSLLVGVPSVDIIGTLDKVSTKRNVADNAVRSGTKLAQFAAGESSRFVLPSYDEIGQAVGESRGRRKPDFMMGNNSGYNDYSSPTNSNNIVTDNHRNTIDRSTNSHHENYVTNNNDYSGKKGTGAVTFNKDVVKQLYDQDKLSTGKIFTVTFERDGNKVELPMRLRLDVKSLPHDGIAMLLAFSDQTKTFWERYLRAKVGLLKYVKDIGLCNDLIEQYRQNRYRDKSGYYRRMMEKRNGNWLSGLLSLSPSINNASSVMIVEQDTLDGLTAEFGGDFSDFNIRKRVFKDTLTQYIVAVNPQWKRVTIYTRGQDGEQELDFADFKGGKGAGIDVNKVIEAYRAGSQPVL